MGTPLKLTLVIFSSLILSTFCSDEVNKDAVQTRNGKYVSIFNVVTFKNEACTSASDSSMSGTCHTKEECLAASGTADGNCAAGFGVCCVFSLSTCGGTVNKNCTYLQNTGYPTGSATLQTCTYMFNRINDDLCNIRLDFDNLVLAQPTVNTGLCSSDTAVATSPTGASPPTVCGTLTGQHMYLDTGSTGNAGSFAITTATSTMLRTYKVKVTYIECSSLRSPPSGCTQYFTGVANSIMSYNFAGGQSIDRLNVAYCLRQEEGFCSFQVAASAIATPNPFQLRADAAIANPAIAIVKSLCTTSYVQFPTNTNSDRRCGNLFGLTEAALATSVVDSRRVSPFVINFVNNLNDVTEVMSGFNLEYTQVAC